MRSTTLTFPELRRANLARNSNTGWMALDTRSLDDWLTALGGEVGEALNIVKKLNRERDGLTGNRGVPRGELIGMLGLELADAVIYADLLAARFGADIDARSFAEFREASHRELRRWVGIQSPSTASTNILMRLGRLSEVVIDVTDGVRPALTPAYAIGRLVRALDILALMHDIDLGFAVTAKFNATSETLGFAERLGGVS